LICPPVSPSPDIGTDEISLKKRHKLYVTFMTDLTDPHQAGFQVLPIDVLLCAAGP
jgi:hypothetical protein